MIEFQTREDFIASLPKSLIVAEIGVFQGSFSKLIDQIMQPSELHLIDIFEGPMCSGDKNGFNVTHTVLEHEYNALQNYFKNNKSVKLHKGKSENVLSSFPDEYFDFIYVDGDHSYNGVTIDLNLAHLKVKPNGIIAGHDYAPDYETVLCAVNDFLDQHNLQLDYITLDKLPSFGIIKK